MKRETIRKKISSLTAKLAALLLAALGCAGSAWGATTRTVANQTELTQAVANAAAGDMVQVTTAGTYTLPTVPNNITIEGTVEGVLFSHTGTGSVCSIPNGATFTNVSFTFGNNNYHGFQHAGKIVMENCTITGRLTSYGDMEFVNCSFTHSGDYHMWVYGPSTVRYTGCTFTNTSTGKFINLYRENGQANYAYFTNCKFINQGSSSKSALNIKATSNANPLTCHVYVDNCTYEGGFPAAGTTSTGTDGDLIVLDPLIQVDDIKANVASTIEVTFNGKQVYPEPDAVTTVEVTGTTDANTEGTSANYTFVPTTTKGEEVTQGEAQTVAVSVANDDVADTTLAKFDMAEVLAAAVEKAGSDAAAMTKVELLVKSTPTANANSISYEVHPEAVVTVSKTGEADATSTVELSNANLAANAEFAFELDVSSLNLAAGDKVKVTHSWAAYTDAAGASVAAGSETTLATVKANKKVSITTTHFSTWTLEGITIGDDTVAIVFAADGSVVGQHDSLAAAVAAVAANQTIVIVKDIDGTGLTLALPTGVTGVTIKGANAESRTVITDLKDMSKINSGLTVENIKFQQNTVTLTMRGTNIAFVDCDFKTDTKSVDPLSSIKDASNFTFKGCTFTGTERWNYLIGGEPTITNLTIDDCEFRNGWSGIYYGYLYGDIRIVNSVFDVKAYTHHTGTGGAKGTTTLYCENNTYYGWTSCGGEAYPVQYKNCTFKYQENGENQIKPYQDTTFDGCAFDVGVGIDVLDNKTDTFTDCFIAYGDESAVLLTAANLDVVTASFGEDADAVLPVAIVEDQVYYSSFTNPDMTAAVTAAKAAGYEGYTFYADPTDALAEVDPDANLVGLENDDNTWRVSTAIAQVVTKSGVTTKYEDLHAALEAGKAAGSVVTLLDDVDLNNEPWKPVGTYVVLVDEQNNPILDKNGKQQPDPAYYFAGTFDGNGKKISNLKINEPTMTSVGLIGYGHGSPTVKNLTVENVDVKGRAAVGAVFGDGINNVQIDHVTVTGTIAIQGNYKVGGIIGGGYYCVKNSKVVGDGTGTITGVYLGKENEVIGDETLSDDYEGDNVGGIAGFAGEGNSLRFQNCSVSGVKIVGTRKVGGVAGSLYQSNKAEDVSVSDITVGTNAKTDYATANLKTMGIGSLVGLYTAHAENNGELTGSVSGITTVNENNIDSSLYTVGVITGGLRGSETLPVYPASTLDSDVELTLTSTAGFSNDYLVPVATLFDVDGTTAIRSYTTLAAAVEAATTGQTVKLLANNVENITVSTAKTFTIDADSFTYSGTVTAASGYVLSATTSGTTTTYAAAVAIARIGSTEYGSLDTLLAAIPSDGTPTTITILVDLPTGNAYITLPQGYNVTIDFNGHVITSTLSGAYAPIENYGTLTLVDTSAGKTGGIAGVNRCVNNYGTLNVGTGTFDSGTKTASNVVFGGNYTTTSHSGGTAIRGANASAVMNIWDCNVNAGMYAVYNYGTANVYGGTFNGTSCSKCTDSSYAYTFSSAGTLNFYNGAVSGVHGALSVVNGTASIYDGTFTVVSCQRLVGHSETPNAGNYYALYVAGETGAVSCDVLGGTFTSPGVSVVLNGNSGDGGLKEHATLAIHGGTFVATGSSTTVFQNDKVLGDPKIYAGTFTAATAEKIAAFYESATSKGYLGDDYRLSELDETPNTYTVESRGVAKIERTGEPTQYFSTLEEAIEAASAGDTVQLLADIDMTSYAGNSYTTFAIGGLTLDLNDHTITVSSCGVLWTGAGAVVKNGTFTTSGNYAFCVGWDNTNTSITMRDITSEGGVWAYACDSLVVEDSTVNAHPNRYCIWADESASITVNSGTFNANANASGIIGAATASSIESEYTVGQLRITGGVFNTDGTHLQVSGEDTQISGGLFNIAVPEELCAPGYIPADNTDAETMAAYPYTVKQGAYVAQIGTTKYETLAEAIAAAEDGDTVTLLSDCSGSGIVVPQNKFGTSGLTVDFGGHTYTVNSDPLAGSTGTKTQAFQLLKGNKITFKDGAIVADNANVKMLIQNYADLTLDNMTLDATEGSNSIGYVLSTNNGSTTINDTTIVAKENGVAFDACSGWGGYASNEITVTGTSNITGDIEVSFYGQDNTSAPTLTLTSGTHTGAIKVAQGFGEATVYKSSDFTQEAPADYKWVETETEGVSKLVPKVYVAQNVNTEVKYETLADAIAAVPTDGTPTTITMIADETGARGISVASGKNFTVDFAGHTYTVNKPGAGSSGTENQAFQLLKNSTITFKNGTIQIDPDNLTPAVSPAKNISRIIQNYANLTLDNMVIDARNQYGGEAYALSFNNGTSSLINGTKIITTSNDTVAFDVYDWTSFYPNGSQLTIGDGVVINGKIVFDNSGNTEGNTTLTITGGRIGQVVAANGSATDGQQIQISGGTFDSAVPEEYCASSYVPNDNGDGTYGVEVGYAAADIVYPVAQSAGVPIPLEWATNNTGVVSGGYVKAADVPAIIEALGQNGVNGLPVWQSYVLGLDSKSAAGQLRVNAGPVDGEPTKVLITTVVNVPAALVNNGTTVTYRLAERNADGATWKDLESGAAKPKFTKELHDVAGKVLTIFADIETE